MRAEADRPELDDDGAIRIDGLNATFLSDDEKLDISLADSMIASDPPQVTMPHRFS